MPGDCHYLDGNSKAKRRVDHLKIILERIGIEPERVRMFNMSAAMAAQFAEAASEMTKEIRKIGKNPLYKQHSQNEIRESET